MIAVMTITYLFGIPYLDWLRPIIFLFFTKILVESNEPRKSLSLKSLCFGDLTCTLLSSHCSSCCTLFYHRDRNARIFYLFDMSAT